VKAIVVDASVAASWLFEDEDDCAAERVLDALATRPGVVPTIWHYEMRNILLVACRRGRISREGAWLRAAALSQLPIDTDTGPDLDHAMKIAMAHKLSFYDALYLELAIRRNAALSTLDRRLATAAEHETVEIIR
jgi:predicted nucleic acid-binding protein